MLGNLNIKKSKELPKLVSVFLDQAFMSISTLLTSIVLARTYDKIDYADLVLLFSITLFILGFQGSIITKPYAINQNDFIGQGQNGYFQFNIRLKLIFTVIIVSVFPIIYYFSFEKWDVQKFIIFLLYVISYTSYYFIRVTLLSERKTKENLIYGAVCSAGLIALLLLIFFRSNKNILFFLVSASIIYLLISLFYLIVNYRKIKSTKTELIKYWRANWKIGKWLLGSNFLFHLSSNIYPWLLLYITTKSDIAVYGVLISVAGLVNPILNALSSYLLPLFVKVNNDLDKVKILVKNWNLVFAFMALLLVIIGYYFGQKLIVLFYSEKYADLGLMVFYPFVIQGLNIFSQPIKIALNAIKRTDVNFWILIPRSILTILLGYFLIKKYGLTGTFYTIIIENIVYHGLHFVAYMRLVKGTSRLA